MESCLESNVIWSIREHSTFKYCIVSRYLVMAEMVIIRQPLLCDLVP